MNIENFESSGFHNLTLENRQVLNLTGVTDVDSFDENKISLFTQLGELVVQGRNLHINNINVETGHLSVEGDVFSIVYGERDKTKAPTFFSRLFK